MYIASKFAKLPVYKNIFFEISIDTESQSLIVISKQLKKVTKKFIREELRTYSKSGGKKEFLNFYYDEQIFSAFCTNFVPTFLTVLAPASNPAISKDIFRLGANIF